MQTYGRGITAFDRGYHHMLVAASGAVDQHVHQLWPQAIAALIAADIDRVLDGVTEAVERPPVTE
ncbi:hypothetical protein D3C81_2219000 [compost metagenome]